MSDSLYRVRVPVQGYVEFEVYASTPEEALQEAKYANIFIQIMGRDSDIVTGHKITLAGESATCTQVDLLAEYDDYTAPA